MSRVEDAPKMLIPTYQSIHVTPHKIRKKAACGITNVDYNIFN